MTETKKKAATKTTAKTTTKKAAPAKKTTTVKTATAKVAKSETKLSGATYATGKRKDSVARVYLVPGKGNITVNGTDMKTSAMINMKERLKRYNKTRTDMLNAVGHDLKTPLTRMRLGIETDSITKQDLLKNIDRMTEMVNGYLAFARGEMPEIEQATELPATLTRIARDAAPNKNIILDFPSNPVQFYARPSALTSAFTNIIENATRFAKKTIKIKEIDSDESVTVILPG